MHRDRTAAGLESALRTLTRTIASLQQGEKQVYFARMSGVTHMRWAVNGSLCVRLGAEDRTAVRLNRREEPGRGYDIAETVDPFLRGGEFIGHQCSAG